MKGTLIGSDYLKHGDSVKFLEINTNIAVHQSAVNWLDTGSLMALLTGSNISEFHFIHNGNDSNAVHNIDPDYQFALSLSSSCAQHNITYHDYEVAQGAITVPYIEDADNKFILRQSYDNTAIIDSSYAADNFEFFDLMSGSEYTPKLYQSSSIDELHLDTLDTVITDTSHPNLVIKSRYPSYDVSKYPQIIKLTNTSSLSQDIEDLKTTLPEDYLIQEFISDTSNEKDGRWSVIRGMDILYGSNLDIIHLGGYKSTSYLDLDFAPISYSGSTSTLDQKSKIKYNSKPMNTTQAVFHTDEETRILKTDNTVVSAESLSVGDTVKTSAFELEVGTHLSGSTPVFNDDDLFLEHYGYINDISGSIQYVSSSLISIEKAINDIPLINITFSDGGSMIDSPRSTHLIEESGSNLTYFEHVNLYKTGDKMCFVDINTNIITTKEISNMSIEWGNGNENVYNLDFEPADHFLVKYSGSNYTITHNACNYCGSPWAPCGSYWCDSNCSPCGSPGGGGGGKF